MGHSHGKKWTDELVKKEVFKVMDELNIDRMPSNQECITTTGSYALSSKISKTGGFYRWAEKLGLNTKDSCTKKSLEIENEVKKMIKEKLNLDSKITKIKAPYDILVENNVKVEVKYSGGYNKYLYSANLYDGLQKSDILILVCRNKEIGDRNYVIPSHILQGISQLNIGFGSDYDKYIDRWDYITEFNDFMKKMN